MRLQQLLYVKEIARCRSMNQAAASLFVSQPSLSQAVRDLEKEFDITIFERSRHGMSLTADGIEFLQFAEKILKDTAALRNHYTLKHNTDRFYLQISCQHYAFVIDAFIHFLNRFDQRQYTISLKETETMLALEDVHLKKSAFSVIVITKENERYLQQVLDKWGLQFHKLAAVIPHVFFSKNHPLALKKEITLDDLKPYPIIMYAQSDAAADLTSEELIILKHHDKIVYSHDRGTTNNLIDKTSCINIGTGYLIPEVMPETITAVPLAGFGNQSLLGYVQLRDQKKNEFAESLIDGIKKSLHSHYPGNIQTSKKAATK